MGREAATQRPSVATVGTLRRRTRRDIARMGDRFRRARPRGRAGRRARRAVMTPWMGGRASGGGGARGAARRLLQQPLGDDRVVDPGAPRRAALGAEVTGGLRTD